MSNSHIPSYYSEGKLLIPALTLGTMTGNEKTNWKIKLPIYEKAIDAGINSFDTAPNYSNGDSEKFLGELLKEKSRNKFFISSKVFFPHAASNGQKGLTSKHILSTVDYSLQNLNSDYLDVLYCHRFDRDTEISETINTIGELLKTGKVKSYGVSAYSPMQLLDYYYEAKHQGIATPKFAQYAYNLFNRDIEKELQEIFTTKNINVFSYYPLAQGVLTGKYKNTNDQKGRAADEVFKNYMWDFNGEKIELAAAFKKICEDNHEHPIAVAYQWCLRNSNIKSVISNVSSLEQLETNLDAIKKPVDQTIFLKLDDLFNNQAINQYTNLKYQINERKI